MKRVRLVSIDEIFVSEKQKKKINWHKVEKHMALLERGEDTEPIPLNQCGLNRYVLAGNGRHRFYAYKESGHSCVPATLRNDYSLGGAPLAEELLDLRR